MNFQFSIKMIIDTLSNGHKYYCLHPLFAKAFEYIRKQNLETIKPGNYEIDGDKLRAIVSGKAGKTKEESIAKFECHDQHIDIQLCIEGEEEIGWKPRETCVGKRGVYDTQKDVSFYQDAPDTYFKLHDRQFAIFFPEDVHAPMIGEGEIKKMVIKVKI
jgi:YhcH/YjgK/YiaL family protein